MRDNIFICEKCVSDTGMGRYGTCPAKSREKGEK